LSNTVSVQINLGGKEYPLKVAADQLQGIESAAALVNERLIAYEKAFGVKDMRDLLAMCALHLASEQQHAKREYGQQEEFLLSELGTLAGLVEGFDK